MAHDVVALEEHDHPARNLDDLLWVGNEHDPGYAGRKTTNGRVGVSRPEFGSLNFAAAQGRIMGSVVMV